MTDRLTWPRPIEVLAVALTVPVVLAGLPGLIGLALAEQVIRRAGVRAETVLVLAALATGVLATTPGGWAVVTSDYWTTVATLLHGHLPGLATLAGAMRVVPVGVLVGAGMAEFEFSTKERGN